MMTDRVMLETDDCVYGVVTGEKGKPLGMIDDQLLVAVQQQEGAPLMNGDVVKIVRLVDRPLDTVGV